MFGDIPWSGFFTREIIRFHLVHGFLGELEILSRKKVKTANQYPGGLIL